MLSVELRQEGLQSSRLTVAHSRCGRPSRTRTCNLLVQSQVLPPLSYRSTIVPSSRRDKFRRPTMRAVCPPRGEHLSSVEAGSSAEIRPVGQTGRGDGNVEI